jgi:hypothetical protein
MEGKWAWSVTASTSACSRAPSKGWARQHAMRRRSAPAAEITELEWSCSPQEAVQSLARPPPDYIIAADCLYTDEVRGCSGHPKKCGSQQAHAAQVVLGTAQEGSTPSATAFMHTCAALSGPGTCCYVALEQRASAVMRAFHASAAAEGFRLASHILHACAVLCRKHAPMDAVSSTDMQLCLLGQEQLPVSEDMRALQADHILLFQMSRQALSR